MDAVRLASGVSAYYWKLPTWAKRAGCPVRSEALGTDYGEAKRRCDDVLNPQLDSWRRGETPFPTQKVTVGTFDWMAAPPNSAIQRLWTGALCSEGPAWNSEGRYEFSPSVQRSLRSA